MLAYLPITTRIQSWLKRRRLLPAISLLLAAFLSLQCMAQPAITRVEYYIDSDPGFNNGTPVSFTAGATNISDANIAINPANISEGVHRLYVRAKSSNGWSLSNRWLFYKPYSGSAPAPPPVASNISRIEYYLDTDPGYGNATALPASASTDLSNLIIPLDPAVLGEGVHRLYVRAKSNTGWSMTNRWLFYKPYSGSAPPPPSQATNISRIEYYFDNDPGYGNATALPAASGTDLSDLVIPVDPTNMNEGVHRLYIRAKSSSGWSLTNRWLFYKPYATGGVPPVTATPNLSRLEYYVDTDPGYGHGVPVAIEDLKDIANSSLFINISGYAAGDHAFYVRGKDANGNWSMVNQLNFSITSAQAGPSIVINSASRTAFCGQSSFTIGYDAIGTFNAGNTFKAYISNAAGSFTNEQLIGTTTAATSGIISCTLPAGLAQGTGYKLRVKSSNNALTSAGSSFAVTVTAGGVTPTIATTGPAIWCPGAADTLTASAGQKYLWSTGDTTQSIIANTPGDYYVLVTNGDCVIKATKTLNPVLNTPPVISYSGAVNFTSQLVSPVSGSSYEVYRFEAKYTDVNGDKPLGGYPRLLLDFEGNGSINDANDRTFVLQPVNQNDTIVTDGKDYYFTTSALPESRNWKASVLATDNAGCSTVFGPVAGPEVFSNADISIFANDITFSDSKPEISSPITVTATIHNNSGKPAENFVVRLVNQFDKTIVYPNITVPYLAAGYTTQVSWNIVTPSQPAWCPMQVFIDATNVVDEPNELDNQAIRPFTNGRFTLPGDIAITATATSPVLVNNIVNISGKAQYRNTAVALDDPSCAGATVTATLREYGGTVAGYTNSKGEYNIALQAPATPGIYNIDLAITDYTLDGDTTTKFEAYVIVVPQCVGPDLSTNITMQPGSFENIGQPNTFLSNEAVNGVITVYNSGQVDAPASSLRVDATGSNHPVITFAVSPLAAGASATFTLPALTYATPGNYNISVQADDNNDVSECYEDNNGRSVGITVLPPLPDIVPWNVPGVLPEGYVCDVTKSGIGFDIRNIGGAASGPFNAKLVVTHNGQQTELIQAVPNINAQEWGNVNFPFAPSETGVYNYTLVLDFDETVAEWNDENNTANAYQDLLACEANLTTQGCGTVVSPVDAQYPGNITINAIVTNSGKAASPASMVKLNVAGTIYSAPVAAIDAGKSTTVTVSVPTPVPGNNSLIITADANNNVFETSENDNMASASLCWDFYLVNEDCARYPFINSIQYVGRPIKLATGLLNSGLYNASNVKVKFEVSGPGFTGWLDLSYGSSAGGSCTGCPIYVGLPADFAFPQEGNYIVRMTADYDGQYTECNEANNVLTVPVTVTNQPDYFVKSEYIAPSLLNPDVNEPVDLDITYENLGQGNGNQMELFVKGDNTPHDSVRVPGVLGGKTNTVRMPKQWSSPIRGIHVIRAVIDHDNEIDEPDELNNEATRAIVVGKAPNLKFNVFTVSDAYAAENTPVNITAVVKNYGYAGIYATFQLFYVDKNDEEVLIRQQSLALDTGGTATIITPWLVKNPTAMLIGRIVNANPIEYDNTDNEARTELGKLAVSAIATNASCDAAVDGKLQAVIKGGNAPFFATWSNGFTSENILAGKGKYVVTIIDAKGKIATSDTVQVDADPLPTVTITGLLPNYYLNDAPATLTGSPAGGVFSGPGISGNTFSPSVAGVGGPYTVTYTYASAAGCGITSSLVTYVQTSGIATYYRDLDGDGFGNPDSTVSSNSQPAGYVVNNTDCNDADAVIYPGAPEICDGKDNDCDGLIDESCVNPIVVTATTVKASACIDDGSITLKNTGGKSPFTYSLNGTDYQALSKFSNLAAGTYTGYVKDAQGSVGMLTNIVVAKTANITVLASTVAAANCLDDGKITVSKTGGTSPYTYSLDSINFGTVYIFTGLPAGTYTAYVKDAKGCTGSLNGIIVKKTPPVVVTASVVNAATCVDDGKISVGRTGGTSPYTYSIDGINYVTTNVFTGLAPGVYTAYVKDAKGCMGMLERITITRLPAIIVSASTVSAAACLDDGKITLGRKNGASPYTYSLNGINYVATNVFTDLAAGTYTGYVKDAKGCMGMLENIVVKKTANVVVTASVTSAAACLDDGKITLGKTGGVSPYTYSLNDVDYVTTNAFTGLAAGVYTGYVKDGKGCKGLLAGITVGKLATMVVTATTVSASSCLDDGKITIGRTGGTSPYLYSTDGTNYVTGNLFTNVAAGTYTAYVKDAKGCIASKAGITVGKAAAVAITVSKTNATTCPSNGTITLSKTGGTSPYTYSIDGVNFVTTNKFINVSPGTYTGYVKDARCEAVAYPGIIITGPVCNAVNPAITKSKPILAEPTLNVSPVPASTQLQIKLAGYTGTVGVQLMDMQGKIAIQQKVQMVTNREQSLIFNVTSFAAGMYQVIVTDEHGNQKTEKAMVVHN